MALSGFDYVSVGRQPVFAAEFVKETLILTA
jgi:hypothetical protein